MLKSAIHKLIEGNSLSEEEMIQSMEAIMTGEASQASIGSFLTALRIKGETPEEITGGAKVMRQKAQKVNLKNLYTVDTCGTGGDRSGTFNISTAVAFVTAAAGIPVVKHGNRSVSSKSGSADVLEALGARIDLRPEQVESCVQAENIGFFFAPVFHQAMKYAIGPRRELGFRTIFNILGPLTNPANAKAQVLGVFDPNLTEPMAEVLRNLGIEHALIVHGMDGLDEITNSGETKITELKNHEIRTYFLTPEQMNLERTAKEGVKGGNAEENARIIQGLFEGETGPKRDILLLNSAAALYVGKAAQSIKEGIHMAAEVIDNGKAREKLEDFVYYTNQFDIAN